MITILTSYLELIFSLTRLSSPGYLELNNFPSMEKASLDRYVNDPMIAEMFNIAGFHYTGKPNAKQKKVRKLSVLLEH